MWNGEENMSKNKTHEEFLEEFKQKNSHHDIIEIVGKYKNKHTAIECRCKICNKLWSTLPHSLTKYDSGCPDCRYITIANKIRKSHNQFISEMQKINPEITILNEYTGSKSYIKCKCNKCGYIWESKPLYLLRNKGCPNYRKHIDYIHSRTKDYTGSKFGMLTVLSRTINSNGIFYKCLCDCGNYVDIQSSKIKTSTNCGCKDLGSTRGTFVDITGNTYGKLTVLKRVENRNKDLYWLCKCECGSEIVVRGSYLKSGTTQSCGCLCSKGEYNIIQWLQIHNIEFEIHKKFSGLVGINNGKLSYDFYLPQHNLLVEVQGEQHERPIRQFGGEEQFQKQKEHDKRKREYAEVNGYKLLEIWYYDYDRIEEILNKELEVG